MGNLLQIYLEYLEYIKKPIPCPPWIMIKDLTVIYLTQNLLPEEWMKYQQKVLLDAIGKTPIIVVSRKPTLIRDIDKTGYVDVHISNEVNILQTEPSSPSNVYWQILKAAKLATTKYIGIAEDDSLYCEDHFSFIPPRDDTFYYNLSHWSLFTWGTPIYGWRNRKGNWTMIANRELVIEALEERFAKYPNGTPPDKTGELGRWRSDKQLGLKQRKAEDFYTNTPIINFNHELGLDDRARRHQKTIGTLRSYWEPYWGKAKDLVKHFK